MTPQEVMSMGQEAVYMAMLISAPLLLTALAVGLAVSVVQAATQINEMTLSFIPKLVAIFAMMIIAGPWMLAMMTDYMARIFAGIVHVVN
ncbi:MAG: flagellar biosynthesis protein FliQ [Burkholderiales bacterium]